MSTLALLVGLLLVLLVGAVVYAVHRRPSLSNPVTAGLATLGALAAVVALIVGAGNGR